MRGQSGLWTVLALTGNGWDDTREHCQEELIVEFMEIVEKNRSYRRFDQKRRLEQTELLDMINEGLAAIRENGTYDEIYDKWFGTGS